MENNEILKCPACGVELNKGAAFCTGCGHQLSSEPKKKKESKVGIGSAFILIPVIILVVVVFFVMNHKKEMADQEFHHPQVEGSSADMPDFNEVVAGLPSDYDGLVERGNFFMDRSMYPLAIECYSRAIKLNDTDPNVLTDLGTCYFSGEQYELAKEQFQHVIKNHPEHIVAYLNLGVVFFNQNHIDSTKYYWSQLIDRFPGDPIADTVKNYLEMIENHP